MVEKEPSGITSWETHPSGRQHVYFWVISVCLQKDRACLAFFFYLWAYSSLITTFSNEQELTFCFSQTAQPLHKAEMQHTPHPVGLGPLFPQPWAHLAGWPCCGEGAARAPAQSLPALPMPTAAPSSSKAPLLDWTSSKSSVISSLTEQLIFYLPIYSIHFRPPLILKLFRFLKHPYNPI